MILLLVSSVSIISQKNNFEDASINFVWEDS